MKNDFAILKGQGEQADRQVQVQPIKGDNKYLHVLIPYNEIELRNAKNGRACHLQMVRADRVVQS